MSSLEETKIKMCRLCTKNAESTDENNLFHKRNKSFLQKIKELTGLTIKDMSRQMLPRYFCAKCKEDLPRAYEFRCKIIESQQFFKSKEFKDSLDSNNKASKAKDTSQVFDSVFLSYKDDDTGRPNDDFDTKLDLTEDLSWYDDNTPAECVETLIEDIKNENFEIESDGQLLEDELLIENNSEEVNTLKSSTNTSNNIKEDSTSKEKTIKFSMLEETVQVKKPFKIKITKTKEKQTKEKKPKNKIPKEKKVKEKKPKEKAPKEKKPKIDDPEKKLNQYVCDKCGAAFQSRPGLVAHLLRHTGERKFGCELCEVKFFSPYELQRHMRFHTGEAPYQCRHCERRFRDYSHRQRHERSKHLNIRPFACSTCGKTFTNNYIAKNHMLTHTKLRQFECKVCDKYFLRQTHLITHYRSVTHKNNAAKLDKINETSQNQTEAGEWSSELMLKVLGNQQPSTGTEMQK